MNMRYYLKEHCSILYKALGDMENSSGSNSTCEASMAHGSRYYFRQKQAFPSTWVKLTKSPCFFLAKDTLHSVATRLFGSLFVWVKVLICLTQIKSI